MVQRSEPMTDEALSQLYLRAERECGFGTDAIRTHWDGCACRQVALVEAERTAARLQAENERLREIVRAVAEARDYEDEDDDDGYAPYYRVTISGERDVRAQALALLAEHPESEANTHDAE